MDRKSSALHQKIHIVNIKQILSGEIVRTSLRYDEKKIEIRQDNVWGAGQSAIEIIIKCEFNMTQKKSKPINYYNYPENTIYFQKLHTTEVEISSRQCKKERKRQSNLGKS